MITILAKEWTRNIGAILESAALIYTKLYKQVKILVRKEEIQNAHDFGYSWNKNKIGV